MNYFIYFENHTWYVYNDQELKNFIDTAVLHNKDIAEFHVISLDSRLTEAQAKRIGYVTNFGYEIGKSLMFGDTPIEAVLEWIK